jgi:hypothetical protein
MTKREFYSEFPNVITSLSYSQRGAYHYFTERRLPLRILAWKGKAPSD